MQLSFIIFLCTQGYNSLGYTTLHYEGFFYDLATQGGGRDEKIDPTGSTVL